MNTFYRPNRLSAFTMSGAYSKQAGMHDGMRATLELEALDKGVTHHHEFAHERVFVRTIDGALLRLLWETIDEPRTVSQKYLSAIIVTAETLLDFSKDAHEVFATYFGIKAIDRSQEQSALSLLDKEYANYFNQAANVIDPYFKSSPLQAQIAWGLTFLAFSSRFAMRFFANPWHKWNELHPEESPNLRLNMLLDYLAAGGASKLREVLRDHAGSFFEREGIEPWDLDDEDAWKRDPIIGYNLDLAISFRLGDWLRGKAIIPTLSTNEQVASNNGLMNVSRQLGRLLSVVPLQIQPIEVGLEETQETRLIRSVEALVGEFRGHASMQASSVIHNSNNVTSIPIKVGPVRWKCEDFIHADDLIVVSGDCYETCSPWTFMRFGPKDSPTNFDAEGRKCYAERYGSSEAKNWLNSMAEDFETLWHGESRLTIVLPLGPAAMIDKCLSFNDACEPGCLDSRLNTRIVFYSIGDWLQIIEMGTKFGAIDLTLLRVSVVDQNGQEQPIALHIARLPTNPQFVVMRALSVQSSMHLSSWVLANHRRDNAFRLLSTDEAISAGIDLGMIERAFRGVLACWSRI